MDLRFNPQWLLWPPHDAVLAECRRRQRNRINRYYPETGPLRRELYPKHLQFFQAGTTYRERLMLAGNRVGKTEGVGAYETALHLSGRYPDWWQGRRFDHAIEALAAGDTAETVRDIIQEKLLGRLVRKPGEPAHTAVGPGTGMIPGDLIEKIQRRSGARDIVETIYVRHVSGGTSVLMLKSYEQGRESFQGTRKDLVWLDEEPPIEIYTECLIRTMTCNGMIMATFTPLKGLSDVVLSFLPGGTSSAGIANQSKFVVHCSWDEVPHLDEAARIELLARIPPHQRDARSRGIPSLGAGAIYPIPESDIVVDPFPIPNHWPRAFGLDIGWNWTAAIWGALDRDSDVIYLYSELKVSQLEPWEVCKAVRANGAWIPGVIDPSAQGRKLDDGRQMIEIYREHGLNIDPARNSVEAGIQAVWDRLSGHRLKVFKPLNGFREEYRLYRRDEKGRIVKQNDHLMDATRYLILSGCNVMMTKPADRKPQLYLSYHGPYGPYDWMR